MTPTRAIPRSPSRARAFTLVELIVALIVGVILAGATTASLSQFARSKGRAAARQEASARAHAAASRIADDVRQVVRDSNLIFGFVRVQDGNAGEYDRDSLLLCVRSLRPVRGRPDVPEGAEAEVQYKVKPDPSHADRPALWRRADAPPDKNELAGGVAQLVVPGIVGLSVEASDGVSWYANWDSDSLGYPHGIRVTTTALADDGRTTAVARRTIAIDRTPIPPPTTDADATGTGGTSPSGTTGQSTTGTTGGGR